MMVAIPTVKGVEIIQFQIQNCLLCSKLASLAQQQFGKILRLLHCYLGLGLSGVVRRRLNHVLNRCPLGIQSCMQPVHQLSVLPGGVYSHPSYPRR